MTDFTKFYKEYYLFTTHIIIELTRIFSDSIRTNMSKRVVRSNDGIQNFKFCYNFLSFVSFVGILS